jgi:hypothetical protein
MKTLLMIGIALMATSAVQATPPDPVESRYLITRRAIFVVTSQDGIRYNLELEVKQPFTKAVYATFEFENPADPATPFVAKPKLLPGEQFLAAESDGFRAIHNPGAYTVKISLYEDAPRNILIGTHEQKVEFDVPKKYLRLYKIRVL